MWEGGGRSGWLCWVYCIGDVSYPKLHDKHAGKHTAVLQDWKLRSGSLRPLESTAALGYISSSENHLRHPLFSPVSPQPIDYRAFLTPSTSQPHPLLSVSHQHGCPGVILRTPVSALSHPSFTPIASKLTSSYPSMVQNVSITQSLIEQNMTSLA